jgi:hypothetical protein
MARGMRTATLWVVVASLTCLAAACGSSVPAPRPIRLGEDVCAKCGHIIRTLDAAAQVVYTDGRVRVYDDLGCLATDAGRPAGGAQFYVQFAGGKGWARTEDVHFASPKDLKSPQGYNYFAYTQDEASRIDPAGWARGWNDLVAELARQRP